jgi:hypothetical protein
VCAYLHPAATRLLAALDEQPPLRRAGLRAVLLAGVGVVGTVYYHTVYVLPKLEYNKVGLLSCAPAAGGSSMPAAGSHWLCFYHLLSLCVYMCACVCTCMQSILHNQCCTKARARSTFPHAASSLHVLGATDAVDNCAKCNAGAAHLVCAAVRMAGLRNS